MAGTQSQHPLQGDDGFAITPHDTNPITSDAGNTLAYKHCLVYCGVTGDIKVKTVRGTSLTFKNFPQGQILPVTVIQIFSTGTTATNLLGIVGNCDI